MKPAIAEVACMGITPFRTCSFILSQRFSNSNYLNGGNDLFYELLKEVCKKKRTSPSAVCLALGMSKSNVTKWKAGRSPKSTPSCALRST